MSIIWTIIVGAIVGAIAKFVMPGSNEPKGFILTAALGIVGSLLAGYVGQAIGWYSAKAMLFASFMSSFTPIKEQSDVSLSKPIA